MTHMSNVDFDARRSSASEGNTESVRESARAPRTVFPFLTSAAFGAALTMAVLSVGNSGIGPFAALMSESDAAKESSSMSDIAKGAGRPADPVDISLAGNSSFAKTADVPTQANASVKSQGEYKSLYGPVPMPGGLAALHAANVSANRYPAEISGEAADLLVWSCAQGLSPDLAKVLIRTFSMGEPWAVGVVGDVVRAAMTKETAVALIRDARANRLNFNVGLMQLNTASLAQFGASPEEALDPCMNLSIAAAQIRASYEKHMQGLTVPTGAPQEVLSFAAGNAAAAAVADYMKANHLQRNFGTSLTNASIHPSPTVTTAFNGSRTGLSDSAAQSDLPEKTNPPQSSQPAGTVPAEMAVDPDSASKPGDERGLIF